MVESLTLPASLDISLSPSNNNEVNIPNSSYFWMARYWQQIDVVADGFESLKNNASAVVLQMYREADEAYANRLKHLDFLPLLTSLIGLSASMLMRKAITIIPDEDIEEGVLDMIRGHLEDIDSLGNSIDVFCHDFLKRYQLKYSIAGIFVDAPTIPLDESGNPINLSLADEQTLNLRPYWVAIDPRDVIDWRHKRIGARWQLEHLRIRSTVTEQVSEFRSKQIPVVKVYDLKKGFVQCRTFKNTDQKWIEDHSLRSQINLPYIPYFSMNTNPTGSLFCARPSLYELAILNINHARVCSNLAFGEDLSSHPVLLRKRGDNYSGSLDGDRDIDLAPDKILEAQIGEDFEWLAAPADAFSALERRIEKYERDAQRLWLMTVLQQNTFPESGISKMLGQNQGSSELLRTAIALESLLQLCIQAHCDLIDFSKVGTKSPISLSVNRELDSFQMSSDMANSISEMVLKHQLTNESQLRLLQRGQLLPEDFNIESEVDKLGEVPDTEGLAD